MSDFLQGGRDPGRRNKTAIIFIHGQGEQRPMADLRRFVDAVWVHNPGTKLYTKDGSTEIWSTPDEDSSTLESRRLTTAPIETSGRRFDFFEFYWAHLMSGNRLIHTLQWISEKWGRKSPPRVRWFVLAMKFVPSVALACALLVLLWGLEQARTLLNVTLMGPFMNGLVAGWGELLDWSRNEVWIGVTIASGAFLALGGALLLSYVPKEHLGQFRWIKRLLWLTPGLALTWVFVSMSWLSLDGAFREVCLATAERVDPAVNSYAYSTCMWQSAVKKAAAWGLSVLLVLALVMAACSTFIRHVLGDSARYLRPAPENVSTRAEIRRAGVALLERLHEAREHDRIVIVAHSLGSIIAYDILSHFWAKQAREWYGNAALAPAVQAVEAAACDLETHRDRLEAARSFWFARLMLTKARESYDQSYAEYLAAQERFQIAQRDLSDALTRIGGKAWLVTDFVSLGSPLTYAPFLLVDEDGDFARRRDQHLEFPSCPPVLRSDSCGPDRGVSFRRPATPIGQFGNLRHDAVFAAVRWHNLYFKNWLVILGDAIGGPLAFWFGPGVRDKRAPQPPGTFFAHMDYWSRPDGRNAESKDGHLDILRGAMELFEGETPRSGAQKQ